MSLSTRADTLTPIPKPYNWSPASKWDGVDGKWSSFAINIGDSGEGNNGQTFRILISTHASGTYLPSGNVCSDRDDPDECNQARGIEVYLGAQSDEFSISDSKAWQNIGTYSFTQSLDSTVEYGFNGSTGPEGRWGTDNIGLGIASPTSPMLSDQAVGLLQPSDNGSFFMGMFGLSNLAMELGTVTKNTFLSSYRGNDLIPSLSYGYTAGAHYASNGGGVYGSLVLGGYDESRFNRGNSAEIPMPGQGGEDPYLIVGVQSLTIYDGENQQVGAATNGRNTFKALIDSTTPYLWLPDDICDQLEALYDLEFNDDIGLYTAKDSERNSDYRLELKIGKSETSAEFVNIILPWAALNLDATWPLVENDTTYFPLKKSPVAGQYVLGRAFLQEAYVIVDYERRNFTVAEAVLPDSLPPSSVQAILSPQYTNGNNVVNSPDEQGNSGGGLGAGAIAGIVVGAISALVIVLAVLFFRRRSQKKKKQESEIVYVEKDGNEFVKHDIFADRPKPDRRASELEDPEYSRSSSAQGYYGHRPSRSGSDRTELMGSPPLGSNEKNRDSYFGKFNPVADPAPLAELPAGDGIAELEARRPKAHRRRSGGSGSNLQSPRSERPDPIAEEHADHANDQVVTDVLASPMTEEYKDAREEITTETTSVEDRETTTEKSASTSVEEPRPTEQTTLLDENEAKNTSKPAPTS